ncbi:MAG: hypothetical protein GWP04_05280 [Gammaproteobacteria bacterium]|nr:hypothetical protein [Gammaproteobacteria bacterium]
MDFPFLFTIAIGIGILSLFSNSQLAGAWKAAARVLGIAYRKKNLLAPPKIEGSVDGLHLTIEVRSSGRSKATRYRVRYPSLNVGLQVTSKTGISRISEFLGAQDAETGDSTFDEEFTVKTTDPDQLATVLTPSVRETVRELLEALPAAKITDDHIVFDRKVVERKPDKIVQTAQRLLTAGKVVAQCGETQQRRVTSHFAVPPLLAPDPFLPQQLEELLPEEPLAAETSPEMMLDSETSEFVMVSPMSEPSDIVPESAPDTSQAGPDPLDVAEVLFGGHLLSFQMTAIFEERYAGRQIRWNGTVAERSESGVTVDVGSIDTELFGPLTITAVVAASAGSGFQPGDAVTVTGTLSGIDAFGRTLTVDGELTGT